MKWPRKEKKIGTEVTPAGIISSTFSATVFEMVDWVFFLPEVWLSHSEDTPKAE